MAQRTANRPASRFLDPATLMSLRNLELRARAVVEGYFSGLHRSPQHGFSVEFTEFREYSPGDDLRYLDWKVYGRRDRYYIRRFEDETNLRCHLVLDASRSMDFASGEWTKFDYARTLAAALAYLLTRQRDATGLIRFDERIEERIPPRYRYGHLRRILVALEQEATGRGTDLAKPLQDVAAVAHRRGLLVLISDLLAPVDEWEVALNQLRARGHELIVFQVLDPAELTLQIDEAVLLEDAESGREVFVDPDRARKQYQQRFEDHRRQILRACESVGAPLVTLHTDQPLDQALTEFLQVRRRAIAKAAGR